MRTKRIPLHPGIVLGLFLVLGPAPSVAATPGDIAMGQRLYRQNCAGCHKWHGGGGGGYGGAALSLRRTGLDRDQIILTASCGRPGTGMPYHLRDAYTPDQKCYGMTKTEVGQNIPPAADNFLRPAEIAAVADYVIADIKGRGEPTLAECQAFFGAHSRVCDIYESHPDAAVPPAEAGAGKKGG